MKLRNKKTGEITREDDWDFVGIVLKFDHTDEFMDDRIEYHSLAELNEEWEDYIGTDPLIKLERVRKAIRAWADVQGIKEVKYIEGIASSDFRHMFEYGGRGTNRGIIHWGRGIHLSGLEDGKTYTITELCGEEE